ncbi:oligoribonuclease [Buchnera aphidicola (Taiwanaphis decaspermi)]|uniref:oligoribonuclease n=1 Tax=Buchnera aphidicola TaxID=9 RepID=UPI0031B89F55
MNKKNLIWIDLEMTGINFNIDKIIEIATVITDKNLNILSKGPNLVIHQSYETLKLMNKWNQKIHSSTGLIEKIKKSKNNEKIAEIKTINFLKKWVPYNSSPMCGNTVSQDRFFLTKNMPNLEKYFHYRSIDVSSLKELAVRWKPDIFKKFFKKYKHSAMEDIMESIYELKFYRKHFIKI